MPLASLATKFNAYFQWPAKKEKDYIITSHSNIWFFIHTYPMTSKAHAGEALNHMVKQIHIPDVVAVDSALEQTGPNTDFVKTCKHL